jgi:ferric-dicitrate binding protein FerR (iron transport regulator)
MDLARRTVLIGLGLAGLVPPSSAEAAVAVTAGAVLTASGEAIAQTGRDKRRLATGVPVYLDDTLTTGAAARLAVKLGQATRLSLGERTRLRIDQFLVDRGGVLVLGRGALLLDRPSDTPSAPLEITAPFGLIAARGTTVFAGPSNGVFGVFVEHGLVTVSNRGGRVELGAGQGTNLTSSRIAPTPPVAWGQPRIAAAYASVS